MIFKRWFGKGNGGDGGDDTIVWLLQKVADAAPPASVAGVTPALTHLVDARVKLGNDAFHTPMLFGLQVSEDQLSDIRERVLPAIDAQLTAWQSALERDHGDTGLSLYAESVGQLVAVPDLPIGVRPRGSVRSGRRAGTLNPNPPSEAEVIQSLEEAKSAGGLEIEEHDGTVVGARIRTDWDMGVDTDAILEAVAAAHGKGIKSLTLGLWHSEENFYEGVDQHIDESKFPVLRELFVGDFAYPDETEISWTTVGSIAALLRGLPQLRWLRVRGGGIELADATHDQLQTLILETGGLPVGTARALAKGSMPELEELVIWFGTAEYGGETTVEDFLPFFTHTGYPKLTKLTLGNAEISDGLAQHIVGTPIAASVRELSFEMGTLGDEGAKALAAGAGSFEQLQVLRIGENFVGAEGLAALDAAFGTKLRAGIQEEPDDWGDGELHRYVSVSE